MKTKKKATIILLLGIIVVAAVICGLAIPKTADAEETTNTAAITGTYKYKTSYSEVKYPPMNYVKEGYTDFAQWWEDVKDKRNEYSDIAETVKQQYDEYLSDEKHALLQEYSDNISKCSNLTDIAEYEALIQNIIDECEKSKSEKEAEELAAQQAAAQVVYTTATTSSYSAPASTTYAATSSSWSDAASAKAFIIGKESGGSYTATNGRYYGAYQLDSSYLNGDYSAENQDRVAENYVNNRYGGWEGAASFWQSHGWY